MSFRSAKKNCRPPNSAPGLRRCPLHEKVSENMQRMQHIWRHLKRYSRPIFSNKRMTVINLLNSCTYSVVSVHSFCFPSVSVFPSTYSVVFFVHLFCCFQSLQLFLTKPLSSLHGNSAAPHDSHTCTCMHNFAQVIVETSFQRLSL